MSLMDVLCGRLPLFKSTRRREHIHQIENDYERIINAPYRWKQPPTGPYNPSDSANALASPLPPEMYDPEYSAPQFAEFTTNGTGILFVLSDTPENGKKWVISDIQGVANSPGSSDTLHFFMLVPGYTFVPNVAVNTNFGASAPGTIRLGIGSTKAANQSLDNITGGTLMEGSPMTGPLPELESGWKIGVVEIDIVPIVHSVSLRLIYRQVISKATAPPNTQHGGGGRHGPPGWQVMA